MNSVLWHQQGNDYQASILDYNAIITEIPNKQAYAARIESKEGKALREPFELFDDFAKAESWVLFAIVDLEQLGDRSVAQKRMLQTIDYCQSVLPESIHPCHTQRLNYIREWVTSRRNQESELGQLSDAQHSNYPLDWIERESNTYVADTPHGQAIIREERSKKPFAFAASSTHKIWIQHPTGAVYKCLETFIDFVDAEIWLQETLRNLNDPRIAEYYLENAHFTLEICKHVLPRESDPLHIVRLDYLIMCLDDALL